MVNINYKRIAKPEKKSVFIVFYRHFDVFLQTISIGIIIEFYN